jgi:tetratricopeptide (TPR) repeat protein
VRGKDAGSAHIKRDMGPTEDAAARRPGQIEMAAPSGASPEVNLGCRSVEDRLRPLWDFDDLDATERRFRALLEETAAASDRAEVLTQLARIEGLRGSFVEADRILDEAEQLVGASALARIRVDLERGRVRRSSGDVERSRPLFESAFAAAVAERQWFVAGDAAHMAALAAPDREGFVGWTNRGLELAESEPTAEHWLGPLLNNLGWELYEAGEHEEALDVFRRSLEFRERVGDEQPIALARYALGKALRATGRAQEAAAQLEQAVSWAKARGSPDGWFHEELAEDFAALGRADDAGDQARLALPLLRDADPSFTDGSERDVRLRSLADA